MKEIERVHMGLPWLHMGLSVLLRKRQAVVGIQGKNISYFVDERDWNIELGTYFKDNPGLHMGLSVLLRKRQAVVGIQGKISPIS